MHKKIDIPSAASVRISTTDGQTLSMCFFDDHLTASPGVANVLTSLSFSIVGPGDFFFVSELEIESSDGSDPEKGRELNSNQTERTIWHIQSSSIEFDQTVFEGEYS